MDFRLSADHEEMRNMVSKFTRQEIIPYIGEYDEKEEYPVEIIRKMHEVGLMNTAVPTEYGGPGVDMIGQMIVTEELCYGDLGVGITMASSGLLAPCPVLVGGNEEQKTRFFDMLNNGKLAAFCLTEPGAGSDTASLATTAVRKGDHYILNGTKQFITNAGVADVYIVFATLDRSKRYKGFIGFIVDRHTPGISVGPEEKKMGVHTSDTRQVIFEDVAVPVANRLGEEDDGFKICMKALDLSRPSVAAEGLGVAKRAFDIAVQYSKERSTFGQTLSNHQAIRFMLADMAMEIEASRLLTYKACWLAMNGEPFSHVASYAKCFSTDTAMRVTTNAVQILGGYGYLKEYTVEKFMRDAKVLQIYEGANQIQRNIISSHIFRK